MVKVDGSGFLSTNRNIIASAKVLLPLAFCIALPACLAAQFATSIATRWSNSFVEWELYGLEAMDSTATEEDEPVEITMGELQLRWLNVRDDFSEWDYRLGDERGTIKLKWKDDPTEWELRSYNGDVVTMRASWANDLTEWRVTNNSISLNLRSRWKNQLDEWLVDDTAHGRFYLYTVRSQDPRDWAIEDQLDETISPSMKLALTFLTIFHSSPKN